MPWAIKLCLAKVTGPSLLYMTVGLKRPSLAAIVYIWNDLIHTD